MSPISAVRPFPVFDASALSALNAGGVELGKGGGGVAPAPMDKLAAGIESLASEALGSGDSGSFGQLLGALVRGVEAKQAAAGDAMAGLLAGEGIPLHQAVLASEEASVSFQLMVEVRNKLLESYQELMRMQV